MKSPEHFLIDAFQEGMQEKKDIYMTTNPKLLKKKKGSLHSLNNNPMCIITHPWLESRKMLQSQILK